MLTRASLATGFWLAVGCSASATSNPALRQNDDGGSSGTGTASGGTPSSGGTTSSPSGGSSSTGTAGAISHAGAGGSAAGSVGSAGSGGSGNTGPVTVGLPFTEDFESGAIAPNLWTAIAKQVPDPAVTGWSVVTDDTGKGAQLSSDGTERFLVGGNSSWTDQKLELRVQVVSGSPEIDIAFRFHALKEYYYLEFADSHFKLRDRTSANSDLQPTGTKPAVVAGTWYKIALQIKGTTVTGSLDDMVVATGEFASTPIAAGGIAIGVGSGTGVVMFDDIHVTLPP